MSKKFTTALCMLPMLVLSSMTLSAQSNRGLSFTSTNSDFATADPGVNLVPSIGSDATIEFWVYVPTAQSGLHYFMSQGDAASGLAFYVGYDNNQSNALSLGDAWPSANVSLPMGQWNHIAIVAGADFNARLYLNGAPVDSVINNSYFTCASGGTQFQLGVDALTSTVFSTTKLDQVRIWNILRTAAEIKAGMYGAVSPATTGLVAYYKMDETSGTVVANSTATTGADLTVTGTAGHGVIPIQTGNNALVFDATNFSQVDIPAHTEYDVATGTIEAWVKPGSLTGDATILANRDLGGSRYTITLDNGSGNKRVGIQNQTEGTNYIDYPAGFTAGQWYHLALVTDHAASGDSTAMYVNGNYVGNTPHGYAVGITGQKLHIGGNGSDLTHQWQGGIDEVRVWNTPLTQAQIMTNIGISLTGTESNLVSVWSFDQGIPDQDNTGLKVAVDNAPLTSNGTLSNFSLASASASNFTLHNIVLPVTFGKFTVTKQGSGALLQWQTSLEQNTKDFIIERSGNGVDFTDIGSTPASGESHVIMNYAFLDNNPLEGKNYYRLRERDLDLRSTYSTIRILSFTRSGNLIWYSTDASSVEVRLQNGSTELYSISDASGHIVRKGRLSDGKTTLSHVTTGLYFVKVVNTIGDELTTKIIIR